MTINDLQQALNAMIDAIRNSAIDTDSKVSIAAVNYSNDELTISVISEDELNLVNIVKQDIMQRLQKLYDNHISVSNTFTYRIGGGHVLNYTVYKYNQLSHETRKQDKQENKHESTGNNSEH